MTEETTIWQDLKACKKAKFDADRARFLADAQAADDGGWTKHTQWHWSRVVNGERLDYWPSRKKYMFRGKVKRGNVMQIVKHAATRCRHCHTSMQPGVAIEQTYTAGEPDFPSDRDDPNAIVTLSPGGPGKLVTCLKCPQCGWSVTTGDVE